MSPKVRNIIGWILTILLAALFIWSGVMKLIGGAKMEGMVTAMGISMDTLKMIGAVELLSILLFIIPRTGVLGSMLLAAYLGGAIATHLEHGMPITMPVLIECVLFITAVIRFPEMIRRLLGGSGTL